MKIPKHHVLLPLTSKNDYSVPCKYGRVVVPWRRWRSRDLWLLPLVLIHIQDVGIVQVLIAFFFSGVVMTLKNDE